MANFDIQYVNTNKLEFCEELKSIIKRNTVGKMKLPFYSICVKAHDSVTSNHAIKLYHLGYIAGKVLRLVNYVKTL